MSAPLLNSPIVFVAADPREFAGFVKHWSRCESTALPVHWVRSGRWRNREVIAIANGAGDARAYAAVRAVPQAAIVCNIGFCGALESRLSIGDVFDVREVRNGSERFPAVTLGRGGGILQSVDHIVETAAEKSSLRESGASVVEMEAAGAARAAGELGVPFYCIRAVSDLAGEDFANDFNAALLPDGRFSILRLLLGALRDPAKRFAELIRLQQRTSLASKNLGDYLANCSF